MAYEVYLYSIPRVSADGKKALPGPESRRQEFADIDEAKAFAVEHREKFDRVVLMQSGEEGQKLVERYVDGQQG